MSSTEVKTYRKKKKKIIMHSNRILDSVANLFVRHVVFVRNVQNVKVLEQKKVRYTTVGVGRRFK